MSECTHDCSTCGESCSERQEPQSLLKEHHPEAHIGKVFGVVSGKGGVDRMIMLLRGEENIREVIAFPMSASAQDLMCGAPSEVTEQQLREVHIKIR